MKQEFIMAKQSIGIGTTANDGTGDDLRIAFGKVNDNFTEIYTELGGSSLSNLTITGNTISSDDTNGNIIFNPNGTGTVDFVIPTQTTVGAAGGGTALPATPTGYINVNIGGVAYVIPYYAAA